MPPQALTKAYRGELYTFNEEFAVAMKPRTTTLDSAGTMGKKKNSKSMFRKSKLPYLQEPELYPYELLVHVFQARNLPAADSNGPSPPTLHTKHRK